METLQAVTALAALAQETRLSIFRLLVQAGPEGVPAGMIGETLEVPPATLSFHLKELSRSGLVSSRQEGRFIYYSTDFERMAALMTFLTAKLLPGHAAGVPQVMETALGGCCAATTQTQTWKEQAMKRFHVHVAVDDLASNIRFYSTVFGVPPTVEKPDYAKWMLDDPRVNFAISSAGSSPASTTSACRWNRTRRLTALREQCRAGGDRGAGPEGCSLLLCALGQVLDHRSPRHCLGDLPHARCRSGLRASERPEAPKRTRATSCCAPAQATIAIKAAKSRSLLLMSEAGTTAQRAVSMHRQFRAQHHGRSHPERSRQRPAQSVQRGQSSGRHE